MLRCAITDGTCSGFVNAVQMERLQMQVRRWAADGVDLIQLREKDLEAGELFTLAESALQVLREMQSATKLLINARADVAIAARAHGVHLTSRANELSPQQVRALYVHAGLPSPVVCVSCHTTDDVTRARDNGADFILFGPVFEKQIEGRRVADGSGVDLLREACEVAEVVPVLALGGVTIANASSCLAVGAFGIAGIRIFL